MQEISWMLQVELIFLSFPFFFHVFHYICITVTNRNIGLRNNFPVWESRSKTSEYRVLCTIIVLYDCKYHTLREKCLYLEFFLVRIFLYLDWVRRDTLSVYSPNAGKCRPEKLQIQILFKQWHFQRNNCWRRKTKRDILVIWFELPVQKLLPSHNWKVNTKTSY